MNGENFDGKTYLSAIGLFAGMCALGSLASWLLGTEVKHAIGYGIAFFLAVLVLVALKED